MSQFADPKGWQSAMNLMSAGMPSMPTSPAITAMVPPERLTQLQKEYIEELTALWTGMMASRTPDIRDRRFSNPAWRSNPLYAFNAASYLLNARFLNALADAVETDAKTKKKIRFAIQQAIDASVCVASSTWPAI